PLRARSRSRSVVRATDAGGHPLSDDELRRQRERLDALLASGAYAEESEETATSTTGRRPLLGRGGEDRERALRTVERHQAELSPQAADTLDELVRRDRLGLDSRYLAAVGSEHYRAAFFKSVLGRPGSAAAVLSAQEHAAVEAVGRVMAERQLVIGTD